MRVGFEARFAKDLRKIKNTRVLADIKSVILECKQADSLGDLNGLKKLHGHEAFYRIRVGDDRIGLEFADNGLNTYFWVF
ncbi:MAG: type II toxin-antitoxin system RelE/ParE family toxin [Methylococcaceae bacterium]|nr:MAG: type II toxin-antitoxin system RelE/ParE family toxin [Methylococcaceae bacterium]